MKRTKDKQIIRVFCFVFTTILLLLTLTACRGTEQGAGSDVDFDVISESPFGYTPLLSSTRSIQMGKGFIYFEGVNNGIFKYDINTGEIGEICTDAMCNHNGSSDSCRIVYHARLRFFKAFSDLLIYNAAGRIDGNNNANLIYAFEPHSMKNTLLDDNASTQNWYCVSNEYLYLTNTVVKDGVTYYNHKQVSISDESVRIFGEETEENTPYNLIGAIGGYLYAQNAAGTETYICDEDTPGEFTLFWERPISYIWAGENDLFFRSRDPEDDDGTYYFYRTDFSGKVITRQELAGDLKLCSFYDGRHLYYIPREETTFVNNDEAQTVKNIHWREMYCLDMETGERTVAFTFDGDYETMALQFSLGNDIIVHDGKIYTYNITQQRGYIDEEKNEYVIGGPEGFAKGIVIIDMKTGDVSHVTADYSRRGEFTTNSESHQMRLANELGNSETTESAVTEVPDAIVLDQTLMLNDSGESAVFKIRDIASDNPSRFEAFTASGEKISICLCGVSPCTCGNNDRFISYENTVFTMGRSNGGTTEFFAYDISDKDNIKRTGVTVSGIDTATHSIIATNNEPYYYARTKVGDGALSIIDMSEAAKGSVKVREYPSLIGSNYKILKITDSAVYCALADKSSNLKVIKAEEGKSKYTELFETGSDCEDYGSYKLFIGADEAVNLLREEIDAQSEYGYSLYQYIYRDGKKPERVLRAKDVCDYAVSGGYFYYTVNNIDNSREFSDQDKGNVTYTDMTGGIIFRLPLDNMNAPREAVWSVGEYYLYGFTPNNKPQNIKIESTPTFIQSPKGGIALQANKKVGDKMIHVYLLIGRTDGEVVMTEIEGTPLRGIYVYNDVGGGTSCNWDNIP